MNKIAYAIAALALGACDDSQGDREAAGNVPATPQTNAQAEPAGDATLPDDRTPLIEPKSPIDPKSVEAAGQVVQHYGALIERRRWSEGSELWSDRTNAERFASDLRLNREVHLEIGKPGEPEGAAGSVYISIPVVMYGQDPNGEPFRARRTVLLRRVNDVPGSSEEQRQWHIEGVETGWEPQT